MTTRTASTTGKSSSESSSPALDRWSQRRLQRLNTEQGFREQRQGFAAQPAFASNNNNTVLVDQAQPQSHPTGQTAAASSSSQQYQRPQTNSSYGASSPPLVSAANSPSLPYHNGPQVHIPSQSNHSPPDANPNYQSVAARQLQSSRSFTLAADGSVAPTSGDNNHNHNNIHQPKPRSDLRQSHYANNGAMNSNSTLQNIQSSPMPGTSMQQSSGQGMEVGRSTPQLLSEDMSGEDVDKLINDHRELRE